MTPSLGRHIIVNYHYIRDKAQTPFQGIHACAPDLFRRQIAYLKKNYTIALFGDVYEAAKQGSAESMAAITFDDGFRDHLEIALPALKNAGIRGTFFPVTLPWEGKIPAPYKLHILLSHLPAEDLIARFEIYMKREGREGAIPRDHRINEQRRFDDALTSNLKETLMRLDDETKTGFLNEVFRSLFADEAAETRKLFMTTEEIKLLVREGMEIGSHTHTHISLESAPADAQTDEITKGHRFLEDALRIRLTSFSYPHGRWNDATQHILQALGIKRAAILGACAVEASTSIYEIPRYDANDLLV